MEVHVLASGSSGNALLVKIGQAKILVDAGISCRRIRHTLGQVNTALEDLDAVLITHEHTDHVCGLPTIMKKYRIPVYTRPATWAAIASRWDLPAGQCLPIGQTLDIGAVRVQPFDISHDAADPVGFCLYHRGEKCAIATDLGFVTSGVKQALANSDVLVLESNHDVAMLQQGSYPWHLKRRIMSSRGHLSNLDAGWALARLPKKNNTQVLLAHISKENNRPQLAHDTVHTIIQKTAGNLERLELHLTFPDSLASVRSEPVR